MLALRSHIPFALLLWQALKQQDVYGDGVKTSVGLSDNYVHKIGCSSQ